MQEGVHSEGRGGRTPSRRPLRTGARIVRGQRPASGCGTWTPFFSDELMRELTKIAAKKSGLIPRRPPRAVEALLEKAQKDAGHGCRHRLGREEGGGEIL